MNRKTPWLKGRVQTLAEKIANEKVGHDEALLAAAHALAEKLNVRAGVGQVIQQTVSGNQNIFPPQGV